MIEQTCQTCYTELSSTRDVYLTPCCSSAICDRCLARNPRLREYNPCLRCGDVRSAEGSSRIRIGAEAARRRRQEAEAGQFTIGDDEDDKDNDEDAPASSSRPPSYKETDASHPSTEPVDGRSDLQRSSSISRSTGGEEAAIEMEVAEITHPVARGDTLMSIARRYAADPHDLLTLNDLPPAAMNTNPRLIQARRQLIIARRLVPKGSIPPTAFDTLDSGLSPEEQEKREAERRVKRFQLLTKTTDPGVGRAYLALAEDGDDVHALDLGSGEVVDGHGGGWKKKIRAGKAGREGRALEQYYEDEEWEGEVGRAQRLKDGARWTVVGRGVVGSKA